MEQNVLLAQRDDHVLTLTLNRPQARNALNLALTRAIVQALRDYEEDDSLHVLVVTGADPAFCAGLDLKDFSAPDSPRGEVAAMIDMWPQLKKPVIAAVNGAAMTGALEVAMACDFIIASDRAVFADTHVKIGAMAGGGMTARLPRLVGSPWAKQMSFTGAPIDAAAALRLGLVNEVRPHADMLAYAQSLAKAISAHQPELIRSVKQVIDAGSHSTLADALALEKEALAERRHRGGMQWKP